MTSVIKRLRCNLISTEVFERDFEVWKLDTASTDARRIPITRRGAPSVPSVEHVTLTTGFQELALSPDGRKVAFVGRGEIWAAAARDGGDAVRVSEKGIVQGAPIPRGAVLYEGPAKIAAVGTIPCLTSRSPLRRLFVRSHFS